MRCLHATDDIRLKTVGEILLMREADVREAIPSWDHGPSLIRTALHRLRDTRSPPPRTARDLLRLGRLVLTRRALDEGSVQIRQRAVGENKVLTQGITALLTHLKDGTSYRLTHIAAGSDGSAVLETATGVRAHVNASASQARLSITEKIISGKLLKASVHVANSEYVGANLREVALHDAAAGGTAYNVVLFTTPLLNKANTDVAVMNIEHTVNN